MADKADEIIQEEKDSGEETFRHPLGGKKLRYLGT